MGFEAAIRQSFLTLARGGDISRVQPYQVREHLAETLEKSGETTAPPSLLEIQKVREQMVQESAELAQKGRSFSEKSSPSGRRVDFGGGSFGKSPLMARFVEVETSKPSKAPVTPESSTTTLPPKTEMLESSTTTLPPKTETLAPKKPVLVSDAKLSEAERRAYDGIKHAKIGIDVVASSAANLKSLREQLGELSEPEQKLVAMFQQTPLVLVHRSSDERNKGWHAIKGKTKAHDGTRKSDARLLSNVQLQEQLKIKRSDTNTNEADYELFGNADFVFFKVGVQGFDPGAPGGGQMKVAKYFKPDALLRSGWVSLGDWVKYQEKATSFPIALDGKTVTVALEGGSDKIRASGEQELKKTYAYPGGDLVKKPSEEVFFGPDIPEGLALTLVQHLRLRDPTGELTRRQVGSKLTFPQNAAKLLDTLFPLIEGKVPRELPYDENKLSKAEGKRVPRLRA